MDPLARFVGAEITEIQFHGAPPREYYPELTNELHSFDEDWLYIRSDGPDSLAFYAIERARIRSLTFRVPEGVARIEGGF